MSAQPYLRPTSALDRRTMGKYDVLCRLSTGGMSEIFLAYQKGLAGFRKIVVLKSILPDIRGEEEFVRMFLDEAKTTALFNHPNIAQVFDLDVDGETLFLAMEFVQGCTLVEMARACRQAKEPIPIGFTLLAVRDTALALHYAHTFTDPRGRKQVVIHRDVAEKNIMVTYEGTTKLLDFGIAKALGRGQGRTSVGMVKGTSGYMSPEQIRGEPLDARSDVFSLGVVLHECLTGMRLFHGKTPEEGMLSALREEVPPPSRLNPEVTPVLDAVVLKALQRERDQRYGTSLEFARAVEKAANGQMWHPEQSGELVLRHFQDRVKQTRDMIEQTQATHGEFTGEVKVGKLLAELQSARESGQPVDRERTRTDPGDGKMPPPVPSVPQRPPPVLITAPPPRPRDVARGTARPAPPPIVQGEITNTGETREITDPAAVPMLVTPTGGQPAARRSLQNIPAMSPAAPMTVQLSGNPRDSYDEDDVGAKTIPAALLPGGLLISPQDAAAAHARKNGPMPPPVPSAPSPQVAQALLRTQDDTNERSNSADVTGPLGHVSAWETFDDESDDPGAKTTVARPFDEERDGARSIGARLPVFIGAGVVVGLIALTGLMYALELGPFTPAQPKTTSPSSPGKTEKPPAKSDKAPKPSDAVAPTPPPHAVEPKPVEAKPIEPAKSVDAAPVEAKVEAKQVAPTPKETRSEPPAAPEPTKVAEEHKDHEPEAKRPAARTAKRTKRGSGDEVDAAPEKPAEHEKEKPEKAAAPAQQATLTLVVDSGLTVKLNGQEIGTTPMFNKPVPVGKQTFKIISASGETRTLTLDIKPGGNSSRQDFESLSK